MQSDLDTTHHYSTRISVILGFDSKICYSQTVFVHFKVVRFFPVESEILAAKVDITKRWQHIGYSVAVSTIHDKLNDGLSDGLVTGQ